MKKLKFALTIIAWWHYPAWSQKIYDGYEAYYVTQPGLFTHISPKHIFGSQNTIISWKEKKIHLSAAKAFPKEFTINDDIGPNAKVYENPPFACVEGQSASASGTAVRHNSVYLIEIQSNQHVATYKLPSLFSSCLSIRLNSSNQPLFFNADYVYSSINDIPEGVRLDEYVINKGQFFSTGYSVYLDFIEPENVWKFRVKNFK